MEKEWEMIEILRHSRHDWLNKLQMIKGNLDLDRMDRAKAIIDQIVIEAQNEAKLSNLGLTLFAALLLKANWENYFFKLEYEILQTPAVLPLDDKQLAAWIEAFFESLNSAIEASADNQLVITIDPQKQGTRFFFDFSGIINEKERLEQFLAGAKDFNLEVAVKKFAKHELAMDAFMPFQE